MMVSELIKNLEEFPSDAIVGMKYGLAHSFKSITHISSHKAHIMNADDLILGETTLVNLHNDGDKK